MSGFSFLFRPSGKLIPVILGSVLLSGCSLFSSAPTITANPVPPSPLVSYMIAHEAGDSTVLDDPDFGTAILVTMQENFSSASGNICKRASLLARQKESEMAVICLDENGQWVLAPRIWGQGIHP